MTDKLKAFVKSKNNLIVVVLAGVLLMVIAIPVDNKKSAGGEEKETSYLADNAINNNSSLLEAGSVAGTDKSQEMEETEAYIADLEKKIEAVLGKMEGAGQVRVIITLRSSMEKVVEKDEPIARSNTTEEDSEGGTRMVNTLDAKENTVYSSDGNAAEPYVVKIISPQVEGVVVLAEGAGGTVSADISEAVQVLFGIEAHRIKVIKMKSTN